MRERLKTKPSGTVCKYLFGPAILADNKRSFYNMLSLNIAHALMLSKQGIITSEEAAEILSAFLDLEKEGNAAFNLNPELEDYYFNLENYLIGKVGMEVGGKLHTARSRNDLHSTISRMNVRDQMIKLYPLLLNLREVLLRKAAEHKETVFTGYTHMQPAQPISIAFYFTAVAQGLERDYARMFTAYERLNQCTLGSGAFAGTSFPIDRHYAAELLGFNGPMYNNMDAVASRDYLLELLGSFVSFGATINRFVNDLYIWATDEFSYIEVDDSLAASSSIMPQKKNSVTLEHCKAKTSHLLGAYVASFSCMKGIPYGHCRDIAGESIAPFWDAADQMEAILNLLGETVEKLIIKTGNMKKRADRNFCTVTELADELVKKEGLSFRVAHHIVGSMVSQCLDNGLDASQMTVEMLNNASEEFAAKTFGWSQQELSSVLDSVNSVHNKSDYGAPSPKECQDMILRLSQKLDQDRASFLELLDDLRSAREKLEAEISKFAK
ncbi:MAG: argininosuccinate lyase [Clostridiales bacterium]